jgi:deferrochelatase/peroxidase EfeB
VTPLDAHIRLANPRTSGAEGDLIFRSGLSFSRGFDGDGQLDQGLAFVSFQRRRSQFLNTQARLAGEPLEEYVVPEGGCFYFALPGVTADGEFVGEGLFRRA